MAYKANGRRKVSSDFEDPFIIFENVMVLEMKNRVKPNHIIDVQDIKALIKETDLDAEILLLKTHFEELRKNDIYWENNPGYDYQIADFLRKRFPSIKAFGMDTISLTSLKNREMGKRAHQAFLVSKHPILIIEDIYKVRKEYSEANYYKALKKIKNLFHDIVFVETKHINNYSSNYKFEKILILIKK